ncbi:hypothetical protein LOTGIDRAFT_171407 [Lottia gigantea]|uniref:Uncharacterized protein n=1 Tax=Lottia gigantea TaxID=225164 RepID=V4CMC3_LOTGI|nr:hypothetical protein LOTGIDRAFT_171407 [Lottia gigantea]ESP03470.1 hypothetical protein LOTGIDRAFT_171407 [Lottia gigantea]
MDWNNILIRNIEYIKAKNKIKTQVENNRLQQLGLTENLQTLFQPILKSQEDIKRKLALEYKPPIEPTPHIEPHHPKPIEYGGIIIRTLDDINSLFSNPKADLPKSISPIVDNQGLLFNGLRIIFSPNFPLFKIDTKDFILTLTRGLIDLMNGEDVDYEYELNRNQEYELGLKYFSVYNSIRNINEKYNQLKISTDNGVTFKTIRLLPGSYEYIAINEYLSEYGGSVNGKNNIEFEGNLNLNKIKLILRNNSQVDFNVENSLNTLLGFDKRLYTQSTLAPHKANIENDIDVINIHCNLINNKYKRQIIYSLPTFTVPIGYRLIEKPFQSTYLPLNSFMIEDINLEIKDGKNRFIDFGNEEIVIQLHLKQKN